MIFPAEEMGSQGCLGLTCWRVVCLKEANDHLPQQFLVAFSLFICNISVYINVFFYRLQKNMSWKQE